MQDNSKNAVIITVGTRDVQIDINTLQEKLPNECQNIVNTKNNTLLARPAGELINKNFDLLQKHISIPIIEPTLEYLKHETKNNIGFIILVATDQEKKHDSDTCFYAEIIKKYIVQKYKFVQRTEIFKVNSNEVTYLDKMYNYFKGTMATNKYLKELNDHNDIYLHLVGGIDAINNAIRFNAMQFFGAKIKTELHVNEETKTAVPIQSVRNFLQQNDHNTALNMVKKYFYEGTGALEFISEDAKNFSKYAHYRLMFDFSRAKFFLSKVSHSAIREANLKYLNTFEEQSKPLLLKELFWNTHLKYIQGNYVDFLLRFFRMAEEFLIQEVLTILNITYEEKKWDKNFEEYLTKYPQMKRWLDERKLKYNTETPSTYLLKHILQYFTENKQYSDIDYQKVTSLYELKEMRNKGIGAHSFAPPDGEEIQQIYENQGICEWLKTKLGISQEENPFDKINQHFEQLLKEKK